MNSREKRTSRRSKTVIEKPNVKSGSSAQKQETLNLLSGEGVQCEMGTEVFRKFWTPKNHGDEENEADQVITGDPIGSIPLKWNVEEEETVSNAVCKNEISTIESMGKVDSNSCPTWTNALSSNQINVGEGISPSTTSGTSELPLTPNISLTNNGVGTVLFPMVLNVMDESGTGTKEVVAVVSLDPMPPSDSSVSLTGRNEISSASLDESMLQIDSNVLRTYTCGDCGELFSNIVSFEKHCGEHDSNEPFKCSRCIRRFKRRQDLDRHIVCHPEEGLSCGICSMKFSDRDEFAFHLKIHETSVPTPKSGDEPLEPEFVCKEEKFQCPQCDKTFSDGDLLQHHEFTHAEGELFPCDQCGRTFREERRLGMHLKLHKKNQRCDKCDEIFTNMFDFNEHMIAHKYDDGKEEYKCVHCKLSFGSFYFLKKHVSNHGMEVHWCGDCGGSGHVEPHGHGHSHHDVGETNSNGENQVVVYVKGEGEEPSGEDDDPLKLEDNSDGLSSGNIGEQLEIQVQVDDVVIKRKICASIEGEPGISDKTKGKSRKQQKREHTGKTPTKLSQEPRKKTARNK